MSSIAMVQLAVFLVFFVLLFRLVLKPLGKNIKESITTIATQIQQLKATKEELQTLVNKHKRKTVDIKNDTEKVKSEAKKQVMQKKQEMLREIKSLRDYQSQLLLEQEKRYHSLRVMHVQEKIKALTLEKVMDMLLQDDALKNSYNNILTKRFEHVVR
jgi:F0F1-type ATP synthase membrane subunit b/b'